MKTIYIYTILTLFLVTLNGCGNASEPSIVLEKKGITTKKEKPKEIVKEVVANDKNITTTHIRVLKLDQKSQIPEHLIKLPIYNN